MVANRENDLAGLAINAYDVHHIGLFYGHWGIPPLHSRADESHDPKSSILFSFETDFTGRVKATLRSKLGSDGQRRPSRQPLILFIALSETKDNLDPGVIPLDLLPR